MSWIRALCLHSRTLLLSQTPFHLFGAEGGGFEYSVLTIITQSIEYRRNGRPGKDAPRSIPGSAAGHLSVEIIESPVIKGGIRATVLASQSSHELPSSIDVPVGRDLLLTAIGGNGEDGMNGEDGVDGRDGVDGVDASETSEATVRTNNACTASFSADNKKVRF